MANWLQKLVTPPAVRGGNLPAQRTGAPGPSAPQNLPNATIIYGIGASLLFVAALFLLLAGRWFPAFAVFALGVCLTGFALHLLKHQD